MARILIIDDNENDRHLVKRELSRVFPEMQTREVRTDRELQEALKACDYDLAITDYELKWSNGLEVLSKLKGHCPLKPVIMFTGSGNEEIAVAAMKAGLDDYVVKSPRHIVRLISASRSSLDKAEARQRAEIAECERRELYVREQAARADAERLLEEAREADRRKDEFLAMLAHELRNPLAPMMNAIYLLGQPGLNHEEMQNMRGLLQRQVQHLSRIVDDLLEVSRVTQGKIELRRQQLDLGELVRQAVADQRKSVEGNGLTLLLEAPSDPVEVMGDATRLSQVMNNLLHNSAKFTDSGGRVIVRLERDSSRQRGLVSVEDTGIGIEAAMLPHVFDVFTQADHGLDRSRGGLGIGLALVKGMVELHGGQVEAFSAGPGKGARLTFWLPLALARFNASDHSSIETPALPSLRILIIEDNPDSAESLGLVLSAYGHHVEIAHTGTAGIEMAQRITPAVILCDLGLPGNVSGYDVARALRRDSSTKRIRLIAVSGYGQPEDQARALAAGFDLHLTKPVDPQELQRQLAR